MMLVKVFSRLFELNMFFDIVTFIRIRLSCNVNLNS